MITGEIVNSKECEKCSNKAICKHKNDLAQERYQDLIDYFGDKEAAKTILEDRKEFKAWLERLRWNVKRVDELARELEQLKGTTKNDLGVDCIDRRAVISTIYDNKSDFQNDFAQGFFADRIRELPSVTPQEPREITLEDVKGYCKPRLLTIITYELYHELTQTKIKTLEQEPRKGHWIKGYTFPDGEYWKCDKCNELIKVKYPMHYCNNCGADMREVEE